MDLYPLWLSIPLLWHVHRPTASLGSERKVLTTHSGHPLWETTASSRRNRFGERVWEKRFLCPVKVANSLENRPSLLTGLRSSQTCFVTYGHTCKRKGQRIDYNCMQQPHHLSQEMLCGLEHSCSTVSAPRCSKTGRHQDWKSSSCSAAMVEQSNFNAAMRSWGERKFFHPASDCTYHSVLPYWG